MSSSAATRLGMVIAALCFLIVLAAIGWGIYEVYQIGHPAPRQVITAGRALPESAATSSRGFENMALPPVLSSIIGWLRAGYPEGVPDVDYIPLFALLGSQLTESEVKAIAEELANESKPESAEAIRAGHRDRHQPQAERCRRGPGPGQAGRRRLAAGQAPISRWFTIPSKRS